MSNSYYSHGDFPGHRALGDSALMRAELENIEAGFDKLIDPATHVSQVVAINAGGTAMTGSTALKFSGTTLTLDGTLVGTGLAITSPAITGGSSLSMDINTPDIDGGTINDATITSCTIASATLTGAVVTSLSAPLSIANGGTNAGSAGAALTSLGAVAASSGTLTGGTVASCSITSPTISDGSWSIATVTDGLTVSGGVTIGAGLLTSAVYRGETTWNPTLVSDGAGTSTTFTVTGASVGDFIEASTTADLSPGYFLIAQVSAPNTAKLTLRNHTGIGATPGSAIWYVLVKKRT